MRQMKRWLSLLLVLVMVCGLMPGASAAGTYTISTEAQLRAFAQQVNAGSSFAGVTVVLTQDIVLNSKVVDQNGQLNRGSYTSWTPIGTTAHPFQGNFDGQGHTVTGLYINNDSAEYQGLFGVVS